ncbi:MAG: MTAP family purine nucleoside phosphorylase [Oceanidesulfovibrio sp.]
MQRIGIIGGSGLDNPHIFVDPRDIDIDTPWGALESPVKAGRIGSKDVFMIARHGREHTVPPSGVNNRAHIDAFRQLECECILATTAVGSLKLEIDRGHLVILDQFIDFTRHRPITFHEVFDPHAPVHTPMADPFDATLREKLIAHCEALGIDHHPRGTVVTIEGTRFSTRAESNMFRAWGADVINMSTAPEAILANEAGIPYAAVAMSTDYDCWKTDEEPVVWEDILRIFGANAEKVTKLLLETIESL